MIGRSGAAATEKMNKAFNKLLRMYVKEYRARKALEAERAQS